MGSEQESGYSLAVTREAFPVPGDDGMCGIWLTVDHSEDESLQATCCPTWLTRRGPDSTERVTVEDGTYKVDFWASVLSMREGNVVPQPVKIEDGFHFAWNGEVYETSDASMWSDDIADTLVVADLLKQELHQSDLPIPNKIVRVIGHLLNTEFAFCLLCPDSIYFARDRVGCRSLEMSKTSSGFKVASVHNSDEGWNEVPPGILFEYQMATKSLCEYPIVGPSRPPVAETRNVTDASQLLREKLSSAVRKRIPERQNISLLFSGGLDSSVLAALAIEHLKEDQCIFLINVSFTDDHNKSQVGATVAADTKTAIASVADLQKSYPNQADRINFVHKVADWNDIQGVESRVRSLLSASSTMDVNIATALWFAAQAAETRVVISGLGADEQMGGYGRHRKAWERNGHTGLREELDMDIARLWERNLGRDDRVISDTSHEVRFPFLDHHVMCFLSYLSLDCLCDFRLPPGEGDKQILRRVAIAMGLSTAGSAVKRAIQFGSRVSHVCDKRRSGSRRKATMGK